MHRREKYKSESEDYKHGKEYSKRVKDVRLKGTVKNLSVIRLSKKKKRKIIKGRERRMMIY